jgi:hypothetical protein
LRKAISNIKQGLVLRVEEVKACDGVNVKPYKGENLISKFSYHRYTELPGTA